MNREIWEWTSVRLSHFFLVDAPSELVSVERMPLHYWRLHLFLFFAL